VTDAPPNDRHVVIVEDRAELPYGHYSVLCADLAIAFTDLGDEVELLTARGWVGEWDGRARDAAFAVRRYGPWAARFDRLGARAARFRRLSRRWRVVAVIGAARARRRQLEDPSTVMVVISFAFDPVLAAALCGPGHWIFFQFGPSDSVRRSLVRRAVTFASRRAEHRRRRDGGSARIAVSSSRWCAGWATTAPFLRPIVIPIAGCRRRERIPDARARLGIEATERVALLFGASHPGKDVDVVFQAFAGLPGWRLLTGGQVAGEAADEATRELLYSAADVVVLSFVADLGGDSGGLMDAIGWGVPVVCSDESMPADIVREYRLGAIFMPGDRASLRKALAEVPRQIDPRDLERARQELSNTAIALRTLRAFDSSR
jgi:glycosyltransferase involved in cell wall biosynthesis